MWRFILAEQKNKKDSLKRPWFPALHGCKPNHGVSPLKGKTPSDILTPQKGKPFNKKSTKND
jgi:hypothetical protein